MTEKSIQEITVKELVAHVHINRSTFYLHYSDISNMLENVKQELIEEIAEVMETYPPEPFSEQSVLFMKDIFFSLGRNRKLYRSRMGENGDPAFVQEVEDLVGEKCLTGLKRQFPNDECIEIFLPGFVCQAVSGSSATGSRKIRRNRKRRKRWQILHSALL